MQLRGKWSSLGSTGVLLLAAAAFTCPAVVVDYSPSAVIEGTVKDAAGAAVVGAAVEVDWASHRESPTLGTSSETGTYEVELQRGMGPKVEEIGDVLVICRPPVGLALKPDSVPVQRVVLRADRDVRRSAHCILAPID